MEYLIPPWAHQLTAIDRAAPAQVPNFALFFEMGAGKTMTAINILRHKMAAHPRRRLRTLIFCPPLVVPNWKSEFLMHSKLKPHEIILLEGSGKKRLSTFLKNAWGEDQGPIPQVFVTNYEALQMVDLFGQMLAWSPEAVIFDESHLLKNYKAKRSKLADRLANPRSLEGKRPHVYILSGSPVLNSPTDLFHQFKVLDGGKTFGSNFFIFRARFFRDKNAGMPSQRHFPDWQVQPGAVDEINRLIFQAGMRVTKAECLDLPEEVSVTIPCSMTVEQTKNYKEMKNELVTFVENNPASVTLAITKALRLLQITSGHLPLDRGSGDAATDERVLKTYKSDKEEKLKELLEELTPNYKVLVWAVFRDNYRAIREVCDALGVGYAEIHGDAKGDHHENMERFKNTPGLKVLIGNPRSGGVGVNLTCAPYSIFYSRNFSLAEWLQARARNHRGGQDHKVTHYDLVTTGTIDELALKKLANKQDMSESLLSTLTQELRSE